MSNWFVTPGDVTVIPLSDGVTITIRRRLNTGQMRRRYDRMYERGVDGLMHVRALEVSMSTVGAYLLDWTVCDARGPVAIRGVSGDDLVAILDNLDPDRFEEIYQAITTHSGRLDAERETEKKNPAWRTRVLSNYRIARRSHWRYEWVDELDPDVYDIVVEELLKEDERTQTMPDLPDF